METPKINTNGFLLSAFGDLSTLSALVDSEGFDVQATDENGRKWLQLPSARAGHDNCVAYLIEKEVDPNVQDKDGLTPLMHATNAGKESTANLLISKGGDCSISDNIGNNSMHGATAKGILGLVQGIQEREATTTLKIKLKSAQYM